MQIKEIENLPFEFFHCKVIMKDNSYFYVPKGYTAEQIYSIVHEHNHGIRHIRFIYPKVKKSS